jgi:hypothetical protein
VEVDVVSEYILSHSTDLLIEDLSLITIHGLYEFINEHLIAKSVVRKAQKMKEAHLGLDLHFGV